MAENVYSLPDYDYPPLLIRKRSFVRRRSVRFWAAVAAAAVVAVLLVAYVALLVVKAPGQR
jgi:hypothetical protein